MSAPRNAVSPLRPSVKELRLLNYFQRSAFPHSLVFLRGAAASSSPPGLSPRPHHQACHGPHLIWAARALVCVSRTPSPTRPSLPTKKPCCALSKRLKTLSPTTTRDRSAS